MAGGVFDNDVWAGAFGDVWGKVGALFADTYNKLFGTSTNPTIMEGTPENIQLFGDKNQPSDQIGL